MQSPDEILRRYERLALHKGNEAETRLKVIDQILFEIFGWTHDDVHIEHRVTEDGTTSFADYIIRTGMTAVVVEAKRAGEAFHDVPNLRRIRLQGKYLDGPTGDAIKQARDYARKLGVAFAAVTNGSQWIVFPATRVDQVSFEQSSAVIFPALRSLLKDDIAEFLALLSRDAVIGGSLENELLRRLEDQFAERRLNRFYTTPYSRVHRSSLFPLIEDAIVTGFSESTFQDDPDLLEKCYVRTPERIRFDQRIKMHIAKRRSVLKTPAHRPMKGKNGNALLDVIASASSQTRPVAVLLVGIVGAGKTTFLNYTRNVTARGLFESNNGRPRPHWIYVDFRSLPPEEPALGYLYSEMKSHIQSDSFLSSYERCVKHAYRGEVEALLKGPLFLLADDENEKKRRITDLLMAEYEATVPYVEKVLSYTAGNSPVFLVVDNVDQCENPDKQTEILPTRWRWLIG